MNPSPLTTLLLNLREIYRPTKPVRDREYLRFIKSFPCIGCGQNWWIDPMHTGPHGLSTKASDMDALPGCRRCHEAFDASPEKWILKHGLDIPALIQYFNHLWQQRQGKKAA